MRKKMNASEKHTNAEIQHGICRISFKTKQKNTKFTQNRVHTEQVHTEHVHTEHVAERNFWR